MPYKQSFADHARTVAYRRIAIVLAPVAIVALLLAVLFAGQLTVGQQRKIVASLSQSIAANVMNGDSFQLRNLTVSAVKSGLFTGIEILAQGHPVVRSGAVSPSMISLSARGLDLSQNIALEGVREGSVRVSNHFSWTLVLTSCGLAALSLVALAFGSARVIGQLAAELSLPMVSLAKAIAEDARHGERDPIINQFKEVHDVWTRHVDVMSRLRQFLAGEAETEKNAAIAKTAENLAHDIKNPLIAFDFALKAQSWEEFCRVRSQMTRSLATIRAILAGFGKGGETSIIKPAHTRLNLAAILEDLSRIHAGSDIAIAASECLADPVFLDPIAIERCIGNLVKNAVEAGASRITIGAEAEGSILSISVADDGPGVPPQIVDNLFKRGNTRGKAGGSGIGLHNVRVIAEGHGGLVTYRRDAGATIFTMTLPHALLHKTAGNAAFCKAHPSSDSAATAPHDSDEPARKVYVGALDEKRKGDLTASLSALGFGVLTAFSSNEASIALVAEDAPDLASYEANGVRLILDDPEQDADKQALMVSRVFEAMQRSQRRLHPL